MSIIFRWTAKASCYILTSFACCYCQANPQSVQQFDPARQVPLHLTTRGLEATLHPGIPAFIEITHNHRVTRVRLPDELAQIDRIQAGVNDMLLVKGMVNGSGSEVVLIDTRASRSVDSFLCYLPEFSPDGRWIAFIKFYPTHGVDGEDHYMVYDPTRTASQNRPPGIGVIDRINVGLSVFPKKGQNAEYDNLHGNEESIRSSSRLIWAQDSSAFVFAVRRGASSYLILTSIANRPFGISKEFRLDTASLCAESGRPGEDYCPVLVTNLSFTGKPTGLVKGTMTVNGKGAKQFAVVAGQFQ